MPSGKPVRREPWKTGQVVEPHNAVQWTHVHENDISFLRGWFANYGREGRLFVKGWIYLFFDG